MNKSSANSQHRGVWKLFVTVIAMFGFGYVLVPLYDVFCDITGLRYTAESAQAVPLEVKEDLTRSVWVEFDSSLNQSMPWQFGPHVRRMQVHPGRVYTTFFVAQNDTARKMVGRAVPSITPLVANKHFVKTECFCFTNQEFGPGERKEMPVAFMVDPKLPNDVDVVTLSYTFFDATELSNNINEKSSPEKQLL